MAKIMRDNNLVMNHKFKAIMFGSEPLYGFQKELINEVFKTKLCYWYGHTEKSILAGNCEFDDRFHVYPQYGITEIINGEMIGTSFWNYATPFIRYKTTEILLSIILNGFPTIFNSPVLTTKLISSTAILPTGKSPSPRPAARHA